MCSWEFVIATKKELTEQYLEYALIKNYGVHSFDTKEAAKYIFDRVSDEIIRGCEDFEGQYYFFKTAYGKEDIFNKVDGKRFNYFYFGCITKTGAWLRSLKVNYKDIFFCVSEVMV